MDTVHGSDPGGRGKEASTEGAEEMITETFEIDYGAKRPLKFEPYTVRNDEQDRFLGVIIEYVSRNVVMKTATAMDDVKLCRLIERISIELCKEHAPTKNYGIKKAEIRSVVFALINQQKERLRNE
jgi:hypothetical protein